VSRFNDVGENKTNWQTKMTNCNNFISMTICSLWQNEVTSEIYS